MQFNVLAPELSSRWCCWRIFYCWVSRARVALVFFLSAHRVKTYPLIGMIPLFIHNRVTTGGFSWNNETVKGSVLHNRNITEMAKYANNYLLGLSILSEHRPLMNCLHHQPDTFGGGINEEITRSLLVILKMSVFFRILKASFRGRGTRQCHFECWLPAAQLPTPPPLPLPNGLEDWPVSQPLCGVESLTGVHRRPTSC